MTRHEYDLIQRYRDLGGNLAFLSANNFFWEVRLEGRTAAAHEALAEHRQAGVGAARHPVPRERRRPNPAPLRRPFGSRQRHGSGPAPASTDGSTFGEELGGYGIEIDQATTVTPPGTILLADILDLYGPGLTAQMTYYETRNRREGLRRRRNRLRRQRDAHQGPSHAREPVGAPGDAVDVQLVRASTDAELAALRRLYVLYLHDISAYSSHYELDARRAGSPTTWRTCSRGRSATAC